MQVRGFHVQLHRRRNPRIPLDDRQHRLRRDRCPVGQQPVQRVFHAFLSLVFRCFQDFQVLFYGFQLRPVLAKVVVSLTKGKRREQMFHVTVITKRARLANQRIDHVPIIKQHLSLPKLTRHPFHGLASVPQLELVLFDSHLDLQADVFAVDRVGILPNVEQAVGTDTHGNSQTGVQTRVG